MLKTIPQRPYGMKIFVIDTGYAESDWLGHGTVVIDIIKYYNKEADIVSLSNTHNRTLTSVEMNLFYVLANCTQNDILITPWNISKNSRIDELFAKISRKCKKIVCTAGNNREYKLDDWTPARLTDYCDVIHCVKKSGDLASFATQNKDTIGMYGTNVTCPDGVVRSGSTISAAIYCGIVSRNSDQRFLRRVTRLIANKYQSEISHA